MNRWLIGPWRHLMDSDDPDSLASLIIDLDEGMEIQLQEKGRFRAWIWLLLQVGWICVGKIKNLIYWSSLMLKNYFKVALRTMSIHKSYSFINLLGLTLGLACAIFITLYVRFERSFDDYHPDVDRIYRIAFHQHTANGKRSYAQVLSGLAPALTNLYPQVETAARIKNVGAELIVESEERRFTEEKIVAADASIFDIFSLPFVEGDESRALERPNTAVLTQRMATKYFGQSSPVGRMLKISGYDTMNVEITGVMADPPLNGHQRFGIITAFYLTEHERESQWTSMSHTNYTYVKLRPGYDAAEFQIEMNRMIDDRLQEDLKRYGYSVEHILQPIRSIHLHSHLRNESSPPGNPRYLTVFTVVGLFILLIACFNFVNLSTAHASKRGTEIGIRKTVGAGKGQVALQFMSESLVFTAGALIAALVVVMAGLPLFNELANVSFDLAWLFQREHILLFLGLTLITGLLSGLYPAYVLASCRTLRILKGGAAPGSGGQAFRRFLVVGQFVISTVLIIATLTVSRQVDFMKRTNLGFSRERQLIVRLSKSDLITGSYESVKTEFLTHSSVLAATATSGIPGRRMIFWRIWPQGRRDEMSQPIHILSVDEDFFDVYGIETLEGDYFHRGIERADLVRGWILNETAARAYGWNPPQEAVGQKLMRGSPVIGVVRDFHFQGLQNAIGPMGLICAPDFFKYFTLTVSGHDLDATLDHVKEVFRRQFPGQILDYFFLDEDFNRQYATEERMGRLFSVFTFLALFIAGMGLVGLASFMSEKRMKEIGVRKVMGASVVQIMLLLSRELMLWVALANVFAWPVAWLAIHRWLESYPFRAPVDLRLFPLAGLGVLAVALATVSVKTVRAATANPVKSLKYE